jgi:CheY-like chemotaxis protein
MAECQQRGQNRVLVVEDDEDVRETLCELLVAHGYRVDAVGNGREALEYLDRAERDPCIVLLDLAMPVMNGWELLTVLQREDHFVTIPVAVVSADVDDAPAGAARYFKKPVCLEALLEVVASYCGAASSATTSDAAPVPT